MKYPTVSSLCEGIAESIRRKEGSTEKINPQDFAQRIDNLQVGGGGTDGGVRSSWRYFDVSKLTAFSPMAMIPTIVRYSNPTSIISALGLETENWE